MPFETARLCKFADYYRCTFSPQMLAHKRTVNLSFDIFPLFDVLPLNSYVVSGKHLKNNPVSSALKISFASYWERILGKLSLSHVCTKFNGTDFDSLDILQKLMSFLRTNREIQLALHTKSALPNLFAISSAFPFNKEPLIGMFLNLCSPNHVNKSDSTSG